MAKYIILRDENAQLRSGPRAPRPTGPGPMIMTESALRSAVPPAPTIETGDLSPGDLRDAARDPAVLGLARAMPTRLIEPEPMDDIRPEEAVPAWGITAVGADRSPVTGAGVRVAVLDTGIDAAHPAFAGVTLMRRDFAGSGDHDANGHGTHCAGTILGRDVDGTRIGVARGVTEALIGKVLADDGRGSSEMLFDAMRWAATERARVISMSLGFDFPGFAERLVRDNDFPVLLATSVALEAYRMNLRMFDSLMDMFRAQAAFDGGCVVVAASGNESRRTVSPDFEVSASVPAAAFGVLSVGALGQSDAGLTVAPFSNTNPVLSGPGVGVLSAATGGGLRALNGTSMACPHVAGVAALWWESQMLSSRPLNADAIAAQLRVSATLSGFAPDTDPSDRGHGLVQAPSAAVG
ncbi:S8 family serine peptidase [Puniceibacterium sp. IMCC21224]|uniref:S8 family peptidase n=1 Tax=Puniceibacterium sp. IMCC21224 TaxID=1618204 RepID=UPI00064DC11A|nr:S8 family serine peptidase [Puniceibacterium sp. IMCC21224]KMK65364.1 subtilisin-like serine protease [Puniceibacterium sp. IMCC21224]